MRQLGVGLVYWPDLAPLAGADSEVVSVLEVELQTLWEKIFVQNRGVYCLNEEAFIKIAALPKTKLVHGVRHPVGGLTDDPLDWSTPFARSVEILNPPWASEHLSFNRFMTRNRVCETGFLLPPRQTPMGVTVAAEKLRRLHNIVSVPVAFETGVNYLRPRSDEMSDGDYFAAVANGADCGIVLDLHNLWANERNGRQRIADVLDRLPLERVWEIHLAGGMALNGYWLDSHSGLVDPILMNLLEDTLVRLPNLGAIIYEILPQYVASVGLERIQRQLEDIAAVWKRRPAVAAVVPPAPALETFATFAEGMDDVVRWEGTLAAISLGWSKPDEGPIGLSEDPGGAVLEQLVGEFRSGLVVRALHYSMLALFRYLGDNEVNSLVRNYCCTQPPDGFAAAEAERFAAFLQEKIDNCSLRVPFLDEILAFERAMIRASLYGASTELEWSVDPAALLEVLETGSNTKLLARTPVPMVVQVES